MSNKLTFTLNPAPFMVQAMFDGNTWSEIEIKPYGPIPLDPAAAVLNYAFTGFEGLKAYKQPNNSIALFRPQMNADRLTQTAKRICLEPLPENWFVKAMEQLVKANANVVPDADNGTLYIRPVIMGHLGQLGLSKPNGTMFYAYANPVGEYFGRSSFRVEEATIRAFSGGTGNVKAAANYVGAMQYSDAAKTKGFAEVIWLDHNREMVEEAGAASIFCIKDNTLFTPRLDEGTVLPSVTRNSVINLAKHLNYNVMETRLPIKDLLNADEVFCCGTAAGISPITEIEYRGKITTFNDGMPGKTTISLKKLLQDIQFGRKENNFGWLHQVPPN